MKPLKFHPAAQREENDAANWYSSQSLPAAVGFLEEVESAYLRIASHPKQFSQYLHGTRRTILDRFPYAVIFRENSDAIQIIAVAHNKRRPGYWKKRI